MKLEEYKKKRDPKATNEPFGPEPPLDSAPTLAGAFVVHQHAATRMHYDLRLERGGVLLSFAVPRGPSLDPHDKRLAVKTEDHPLEYLDFEAIIPEGQYGAGPMIVWDRGRVRYLDGSAEEGLARGKVDFELEGLKVKGRFALVKIKAGKENEWLLFKKQDAFARQGGDLPTEKPRSILSGLTVFELAEIPNLARAIEAKAASLGAPEGIVHGQKIVPMACSLTGAPDHGEGWLYELKLDGVRAIASKREGRVTIIGRKLRETTATYPEITRAVRALPADVVLDGEIVALDESGQPSFQRLGPRMHLSRPRDIARAMIEVPVTFVVFDLLAIGGRDLRPLPTVARKALLSELMKAPGILRALDHLENDARPLLAFCKQRHLEGVVAKKKDAPYREGPRRSDAWVKMKCERDEEFVVVGLVQGERDPLGSLDIATYSGSELVYRGKVGSGLDKKTADLLLAKLGPLRVEAPVASGEYAQAPRGRSHVRPEIVIRVRFLGFSDDGQVRHPVFEGLRDDIAPRECTSGPPRHTITASTSEPEQDASPTQTLAGDQTQNNPIGAGAPIGGSGSETEAPIGERGSANSKAGRLDATASDLPAVTNKNKILWAEDGITKGQLVAYYVAIGPTMIRYLKDRPTMLVRYPDGIAGKFFFQWNVPAGVPAWARTCRIVDEKGEHVEVFLIDDVRTLAYVANLAAIPIHVLAGRASHLHYCDFLTIDFDVGLSSLPVGVELALSLREILTAIGIEGFPKTSGQTGLHVLVPLGKTASYDTAKFLADVLGRLLVKRHPKDATMERVRSKRGARVLVDTGQTGPTRMIVAPYAVRAAKGATVSTPLSWDEVTPDLDPKRFSIMTVPARVAARGDPMARLLEVEVNLGHAVKRLEELVKQAK